MSEGKGKREKGNVRRVSQSLQRERPFPALLFSFLFSLFPLLAVSAQYPAGHQGSPNVRVVAHIPLGAGNTVGDVEIEQELSRPYVYVPRLGGIHHGARGGGGGFTLINIKDPSHARTIYDWRIENGELHQGYGGLQ